MTANIRIVPRNFHDEATLTASEAASGFPVTNTQSVTRDTAWRSSTTGTVTISGTFSRDRIVNFFGVFRHVNQGCNIRFQAYSDNNWTTPATGGDTTTVPINKVVGTSADTGYAWGDSPYGGGVGGYDPLITLSPYWFWFPADVTLQSYKITLSSHSTTFWPFAYYQISRLWLGKYFEPARSASFGAGLGFASNTDSVRTRGGSLRSNLGSAWRVAKMDLGGINEDESPVWLDIMNNCLTGKDVVISLFPTDGNRRERDNIMCCKLSSLDVLNRQVKILTKTIAIEEI